MERCDLLEDRFSFLGGYDYEARSRRIVYSLGFTEEDLDTPASAFSGGQKTRINLAKALVRQVDFLVLDEPTNHLDMEMLEWLEGYLASFPGGILLVSHDRFFLDKVCTGIVELNHNKAKAYKGNYTRYLSQKEAEDKAYQKAYEKQQEYIKKTEAYIEKYRAGIKSKMARGRQSQLDRLERLDAPVITDTLSFSFPKPKPCADIVLFLQEVSAGYPEKTVIDTVDLLVRRGDCVALIGPNGAGKSTLVKTIMGELDLIEGHITIGDRVMVGYFSQEHEELHNHWTVLEEVMQHSGLGEGAARNILGTFLFRGDAVFRLVGSLSGGERARLALLKLFLEGNNFLILDEPTNHLDIPTREVVEEALLSFGGTYLIISHDRYFLDKISKRTVCLENGKFTEYLGNYSYYREKLAEKEALLEEVNALDGSLESAKGNHEPKEDNAQKVQVKKPLMNDYMREKRIEELETKIAQEEATLRMYEVMLENPEIQTDAAEIERLSCLLHEVTTNLEALYQNWENLQEDV